MAYSGFPGLNMLAWFGLLAPAGTPPAVTGRISDALLKGLNSAEGRKRLAALGGEPGNMTPAEFARYIHAETTRWKKILTADLVIRM